MPINTYFPLRVHSHFSLSLGLSMPKHIAKRCSTLGLPGACVTDYDSISGAFDVMDAMGGKKLKSIMGCEFTIVNNHEEKTKNTSSILLIAKNMQGWLSLVKAIYAANKHYYHSKPHITLEELAQVIEVNSVFAITGSLGSQLSSVIFNQSNEVYLSSSYEVAKTLVNPNWLAESTTLLNRYKEIFGSDNVFLGHQLVDAGTLYGSKLMSEGVKYLAKKTETKLVAIPDSYYSDKEDFIDQRVLLANRLNTTLRKIHNKPVQGEDIALGRFFSSSQYYIPSFEEMIQFGHTEEELERTLEIGAACIEYSLKNKPMLPKFDTPNGMPSKDYLRELCREGWRKRWPQIEKVIQTTKHTKEEYTNRFNTEYEVLTSVGLEDYFLIVHDVINYAISDGQIVGAGRGSAAGSIILYLLGVTHADPIEYDLLFERFYNAGRNTPGNIEFPDVDMDFEKAGRERNLSYVRAKYGHERVAQMITFSRMQGRGAIKDVVRAHEALDNDVVNRITKFIPQDSEISDQLEIIREADKKAGGDGDASIIEWALDNHPKDFEEWVHYDDNGNLQGSLSKIFEQAIRMEGTKRGSSRHASGIVISQHNLGDFCPMAYDPSTGEMIAALEMGPLAKAGQIKFDFLGINTLDKCHGVLNHLRTGVL